MMLYKLSQDSKELDKMFKKMSPQNFKLYARFLLRALSNDIRSVWMQQILKSNAKMGWKRQYASSIQIRDAKGAELTSEIFTDSKYAFWIEKGIKRFDMKQNKGPKGGLLGKGAKRNEETGELYRVIFMRKGTPGTQHMGTPIPSVLYAKVKQLPIGKFLINTQNIKPDKNTTKKEKQDILAGHYEGLGKSKFGGYGTFRVVTQRSKGWFYPGSKAVEIYPSVGQMIPGRVKKVSIETIEVGLKRLMKEAG